MTATHSDVSGYLRTGSICHWFFRAWNGKWSLPLSIKYIPKKGRFDHNIVLTWCHRIESKCNFDMFFVVVVVVNCASVFWFHTVHNHCKAAYVFDLLDRIADYTVFLLLPYCWQSVTFISIPITFSWCFLTQVKNTIFLSLQYSKMQQNIYVYNISLR